MKKGKLVLTLFISLLITTGLRAQNVGCVSGNCIDGYGTYQYDNGKYEGRFAGGLKDGKGVYTWTSGIKYDGDWISNTMNGTGTITFADGTRYTGEVKDGVANDNGIYYLKDGGIDKTRGLGKTTTQPVIKTGCVSGNCTNGFGTFIYDNSGTYEGDFVNGYRSGYGKFSWASGEKYAGNWVNGKMDGLGTSFYADGTKYIGEYKDGVISGKGTYYLADGTVDPNMGKIKKEADDSKIVDDFNVILDDILDDVDIDFVGSMGRDISVDYPKENTTTYECLYSFKEALNSRIELNHDTYTYVQISDFYSGYSKKDAMAEYDLLLGKMKASLPDMSYTYKEETPGDKKIKSMIAGIKYGIVAESVPAANLRIEKDGEKYTVLIEIGYKEF